MAADEDDVDSPPTARPRRAPAAAAAAAARPPTPLPLGRAPTAAAADAAAADDDDAGRKPCRYATLDCCIKLLVVHAEPSFSLPWTMKRQYQSSSSGFVIAGRRLLTNAHCVEHHVLVKVKRRDSSDRYLAEVLAVSTEADLALLTVRDEAFWAADAGGGGGGEAPAVTFAPDLPRLQERMSVAGFSVGGVGLSCTAGVVSRIEPQLYAHSGAELLAVQSDAPINSGNSGGPAFQRDGRVVGVSFQSLTDADGVGYIIPMPIVNRFLCDVERHGRYTGFAGLGVSWQKLESHSLRRALGLPEAVSRGVLVARVDPTAPAAAVLRRGDVILAFDGVEVSSDGTVPFRRGERIAFSYLVSQKFVGDSVDLLVLRAPPGALAEEGGDGDESDGDDDDDEAVGNGNGRGGGGRKGGAAASSAAAAASEAAAAGAAAVGAANRRGPSRPSAPAAAAAAPRLPLLPRQAETVRVRLERPERLVPYHLEGGRPPSYYVFGGLVFTPLTAGFLRSEFGREYESEAPVSLVSQLTHGVSREKGEQVVLLSQVLAHSCNVGFEDVAAAPVRCVNGRRVRSLRALVRETEAALARREPFLRFSLAQRSEVVLDADEAQEATPHILKTHSIARDRSADLLSSSGGGEQEEAGEPGAAAAAAAAGAGKKKRARV